METEDTGILKIEVTDSEEIFAQKVDIYIVIRGTSLVIGNAALSRAREVAQLISDLRKEGLTDSDFKLLGVQADVNTGILGRNSSAKYSLKIHCDKVEILPDVLGAITSQKNISLNHLQWDYGDLREVRDRLLNQCILSSNQKAARIAAGLGVKIVGVCHFSETFATPGIRPDVPGGLSESMGDYGAQGDAAYSKARMASRPDLGMQISHGLQVYVTAKIEYRISMQAEQG